MWDRDPPLRHRPHLPQPPRHPTPSRRPTPRRKVPRVPALPADVASREHQAFVQRALHGRERVAAGELPTAHTVAPVLHHLGDRLVLLPHVQVDLRGRERRRLAERADAALLAPGAPLAASVLVDARRDVLGLAHVPCSVVQDEDVDTASRGVREGPEDGLGACRGCGGGSDARRRARWLCQVGRCTAAVGTAPLCAPSELVVPRALLGVEGPVTMRA